MADDEAFAVEGTACIGIGYRRASSARFHIRHQGEVNQLFLMILDQFREAAEAAGTGIA